MLFAIVFNMLSSVELENRISHHFCNFFTTKFMIGLIVGVVFLILSLLTNLIFRKIIGFSKKRLIIITLIEFTYCVLFSLGMTLYIIYLI